MYILIHEIYRKFEKNCIKTLKIGNVGQFNFMGETLPLCYKFGKLQTLEKTRLIQIFSFSICNKTGHVLLFSIHLQFYSTHSRGVYRLQVYQVYVDQCIVLNIRLYEKLYEMHNFLYELHVIR